MSAVIEAEGLEKRFGTTQALAGTSFSAERGTVLALLGPNGAGKTTAVRVLSTLIKPDAGVARICGFDVMNDAVQVRQLIALTGQYASVDDELTGSENLIMIGRLLGLGRPAGPRQGQGAAGPVRADRGRAAGGQDVLRRHAAPARPGREPGRIAAGDLPGRAHHRARPAGPQPGVGNHPRADRGRRDRAADHAVPGRGGRAGRPDRGHRPGPGGGVGHGRRPEGHHRDTDHRGPAGGPVPGPRGGRGGGPADRNAARGPHRDRAGHRDRRRPGGALGTGAAAQPAGHRGGRAGAAAAQPGRGVPDPDRAPRRRPGRDHDENDDHDPSDELADAGRTA